MIKLCSDFFTFSLLKYKFDQAHLFTNQPYSPGYTTIDIDISSSAQPRLQSTWRHLDIALMWQPRKLSPNLINRSSTSFGSSTDIAL